MAIVKQGPFGVPVIEGLDDQYWSFFPPEVQELRWMDGDKRGERAVELARQGFLLDTNIHVMGWDPLLVMQQRTYASQPYTLPFNPDKPVQFSPLWTPNWESHPARQGPSSSVLPTVRVPESFDADAVVAEFEKLYPRSYPLVPKPAPSRRWWEFWR